MAYTTINKSTDHFNTKLYTGTGSSNAQTGVGFQPDFTWIKSRSNAYSHTLTDAVRGVTKHNASNSANAEYTSTTEITSFDSDGFTVGTDAGVNNNSSTFASWNWKANGTGSANTDGSTSSTVSANTTAGFSIVKWTPSGSAETVGHGLGSVPKMIITKNLGASQGWFTYHHSIGNTNYLLLNSTAAEATDSTAWNNTTPTSSVFSVSSQFAGSDYVAYCFAEKTGFSKFGSYTGNASTNGPFVYTGFKPAFVMIKVTNGVDNWFIFDNRRSTSGGNVVDDYLYPNLSNAEGGTNILDFLSNGFKLRTTDGGQNGSSNYIYMAFAEAPLVGSNNITATAR